MTTLDTMCGSVDYPGTTKWSLMLTLYQSFDVGATEEILSAAVAAGEPCPFEICRARRQPISATNPTSTGKVRAAAVRARQRRRRRRVHDRARVGRDGRPDEGGAPARYTASMAATATAAKK